MGRSRAVVAVALALLIILVAVTAILRLCDRDERQYAEKLETYEKGESEYAKLARTTGGEHLFLDDDTDLSAFLSQSGLEAVIWKQIGSLDETGESKLEIPVDASVTRLGLSILGSSARGDSPFVLSAVEPGGRRVEDEPEGVRATKTKNGVIYLIEAPAPGTWELTFTGHGSYQLSVIAESEVSWGAVRFVEMGGRPGHEGWFPVSGLLSAGQEQSFEAELSGILPGSPEISLIDPFGDPLGKAAIVSRDEASDGEILGRVTVPKRTFRFVVRAGDVQRVTDKLFDPGASQKTYSWTYRSATPESDCAVVDFLLLMARGTREIDQIIWTCVQRRTAAGSTQTASANLILAAADLPEAGGSLSFEALNLLGDGPLELPLEDCERYSALFDRLDAEAEANERPAPALHAQCAPSGASARLRLEVSAAGSGPPSAR